LAAQIAAAIQSYKKEYFVADSNDHRDPVPAQVEKPKADPIQTPPAATQPVKGVQFKVQIAASGKDLETVPSNFNGLSGISKDKSTSLIKYYYGDTNDYNQAKSLLEQAKAKGYPSAFVVAFRDGKKITVQEALEGR
ncbi:MAG TPA: N-acetylmuramoyl-L-alanine amidase, partial [Flavobacterium sp.]|nr:N-acetylmuramoyl-L-alanine amidase [Flavobacterium sp.]